MLKIYIYGYLNRIQSSRRLEAEANRNVELMWLVERLNPDFKTIARFRNENDPAILKVCSQFVELCRRIHLFADAMKIRRCTIEHTFGTLKHWMGASTP
jgi:transposase